MYPSAEAAVEKAKHDLILQNKMRIPDPTFLAQYERNPPGQTDSVGFGVSFPLPLWNRNNGNIKAAESAKKTAEVLAGKTKAQAVSDIASATLDFEEANARFHRYKDEIQPASAKVLKTVSYAYEKGGASLLDLLDAEQADNTVRLATAQGMADGATTAATLAAARNLNRNTGVTELEKNEKPNALSQKK